MRAEHVHVHVVGGLGVADEFVRQHKVGMRPLEIGDPLIEEVSTRNALFEANAQKR